MRRIGGNGKYPFDATPYRTNRLFFQPVFAASGRSDLEHRMAIKQGAMFVAGVGLLAALITLP